MSMPSLSHWLTKTIATEDEAAKVAADDAFVPSLNCTFAPVAIAWIAFSGDEGSHTTADQPGTVGYTAGNGEPPTGCTCAEPPPESTATSACDPMTAIDATLVLSGRTPVFFSKTAPCSSSS